jgi:hypothetical protein
MHVFLQRTTSASDITDLCWRMLNECLYQMRFQQIIASLRLGLNFTMTVTAMLLNDDCSFFYAYKQQLAGVNRTRVLL